MTDTKVFFALPCYNQQVYMQTANALCYTVLAFALRGISHQWRYMSAVLPHVRNVLFADFLNSDATHLFWIDTDISFHYNDCLKLLKLCGDADIALAGYVKKQADRASTVLKGGEWIDFAGQTEPIDVDGAGMGFVCVRRPVVERLAAVVPVFDSIPQIVTTGLVNGQICVSEDYSFFVRAKSEGYKIMLDPTIKLIHTGPFDYT